MSGGKRPILVTGSSGKLGRVLREVWPGRLAGQASLQWHSRGGCEFGLAARGPLGPDPEGPSLAGGVIVHLAGGRIDTDETVRLALVVCKRAARQGAAHVLLASSGAVYGAGAGRPLHEDDSLHPVNAYGAGKAAMEAAVRDWRRGAGPDAPGVTCLRIGNVLGSDALIGRAVAGRPVTLDPVAGQSGGPVRSYVGPFGFAEALARLCLQGMDGRDLPAVLNLAAFPPVAMGDLLDAAGLAWSFGPPNPAVTGSVVLDLGRLGALIGADCIAATPASMVAEWRALQGPPA